MLWNYPLKGTFRCTFCCVQEIIEFCLKRFKHCVLCFSILATVKALGRFIRNIFWMLKKKACHICCFILFVFFKTIGTFIINTTAYRHAAVQPWFDGHVEGTTIAAKLTFDNFKFYLFIFFFCHGTKHFNQSSYASIFTVENTATAPLLVLYRRRHSFLQNAQN